MHLTELGWKESSNPTFINDRMNVQRTLLKVHNVDCPGQKWKPWISVVVYKLNFVTVTSSSDLLALAYFLLRRRYSILLVSYYTPY